MTFWEVAMLKGRLAWTFPRMLGYGAGKCLFKESRRYQSTASGLSLPRTGGRLLLAADDRILGWSGPQRAGCEGVTSNAAHNG